jgi:hypothetical protein
MQFLWISADYFLLGFLSPLFSVSFSSGKQSQPLPNHQQQKELWQEK